MNWHDDYQATNSPPVSIRSLSRIDSAIVFDKTLVRWKSIEVAPAASMVEEPAKNTQIDLVAEQNNQIVGWLRATRTCLRSDPDGAQPGQALKQAWWMPPTHGWNNGAGLQADPQGDILLGTGMGILERIADSPAQSAHIVAMMAEFGRNRLVRQLGLSRWVAQIPLADPETWQNIYSTPGYVQQVEFGALEDPLLSQYLRQGARVLEVLDDEPSVWLVWENPVR